MARKVKVRLYTYTARRVFIYAPGWLSKVLKPFTITTKEYNNYLKTSVSVVGAIESLDFKERVDFRVRPWLLWFWNSFEKGAFKSPVITVNGKLFSKGVVPDKVKLKEFITYKYKKEVFLRK